jgi:DNA invertase Pin-like site-specific DNA recombinase
MNGSAKIQATHRQRLAVVYVRQSDPKQVLKNRESGLNQRALKARLVELGWKPDRVLLLDEDQGHSAKDSAGRDGFQKLAADVGLGKVGIVMGYEVSRSSTATGCADRRKRCPRDRPHNTWGEASRKAECGKTACSV